MVENTHLICWSWYLIMIKERIMIYYSKFGGKRFGPMFQNPKLVGLKGSKMLLLYIGHFGLLFQWRKNFTFLNSSTPTYHMLKLQSMHAFYFLLLFLFEFVFVFVVNPILTSKLISYAHFGIKYIRGVSIIQATR